jgi:hypothetical protein
MRRFLLIIVLLIGFSACWHSSYPSPPIYSTDTDIKSHNDGIIEINKDKVFINSKNQVFSVDFDGNNQKLVLSYGQGTQAYDLLIRDSVILLKHSSPGLFFMEPDGVFSKAILYGGSSRLKAAEVAVTSKRVLLLDIGKNAMPHHDPESGGTLEMFKYDKHTMQPIPWPLENLHSDGFFRFQDSIIYSYNHTSSWGSMAFSRFNIYDSLPVLEQGLIRVEKQKNFKTSTCVNGNDLYITDGKNIYICEMKQKFFMIRTQL